MESDQGLDSLFEHDLIRPSFARRSGLREGGKPASTFRDHALRIAGFQIRRKCDHVALRQFGDDALHQLDPRAVAGAALHVVELSEYGGARTSDDGRDLT